MLRAYAAYAVLALAACPVLGADKSTEAFYTQVERSVVRLERNTAPV